MNNMIGAYGSQLQVSVTDLVEEHLPLVKRIATHFTARLPPHIELDDLTQVGLIGLLKAIEDYKPDSGAVFTTYATIRIRGAILDELRSRDWLPRGVQKNLGKVSSAVAKVEQRVGRSARSEEVAAELGVSLAEYQSTLSELAYARVTSIEDSELLQGDFEPDKEVSEQLKKDAMAEAITQLPEKEQLVMSLYYADELNLKEIGLILNVSESRVSQIHGQAIARLQSKLTSWS